MSGTDSLLSSTMRYSSHFLDNERKHKITLELSRNNRVGSMDLRIHRENLIDKVSFLKLV